MELFKLFHEDILKELSIFKCVKQLFSVNKLSFSSLLFYKAKPVVVNTTPVRMSVPLVSAQTVKQVSITPLLSVSPKQEFTSRIES